MFVEVGGAWLSTDREGQREAIEATCASRLVAMALKHGYTSADLLSALTAARANLALYATDTQRIRAAMEVLGDD